MQMTFYNYFEVKWIPFEAMDLEKNIFSDPEKVQLSSSKGLRKTEADPASIKKGTWICNV